MLNEVQTNHRRVAVALQENVVAFLARFGLQNCAFFTLTFSDHVTDPAEAQRRFRSLRAHVLAPRYRHYIRVFERQKSGRIHLHLLVCVGADVRSGVDFAAFARRDYRSASVALRREWKYWRETAPRYRFGRCEMMPVRSTAGAIGQYLGKYIAKHIEQRQQCDKGVRLVEYSGGARAWSARFAFREGKAKLWREQLEKFAAHQGIFSYDRLSLLGRNWAYHLRDVIIAFQPADWSRYPAEAAAMYSKDLIASQNCSTCRFSLVDIGEAMYRYPTPC